MPISQWAEFVSHTRHDTGGGNAKQTITPPRDGRGAPIARAAFVTAEGGIAIITLDGTDPTATTAALRIPDGGLPFYIPVGDKDWEMIGSVANTKLHVTWVK